MYGVEQEVLIKKLNPILRGFANYYISASVIAYFSTREER
jgi:hypothetical protein